ncbi:uncharacterized protein LOC134190793 isoform X2 [Corticium candelabrum]|uniref:uncharacterized protein LOC134190793 isoform X2 n=1 Tax=Corticium candelabrum TaxID=121492 RepID=UPI002E27588C|nr:uncharacterized protein LOC134190793 isoform X2 [Corticium candelabrum]
MMEEAIRLRSHPYVKGDVSIMKHQYEETIAELQSEVEKMKEELRQSFLPHEVTMLINKIQEKGEEMRCLVCALASRMASEKVGEGHTTSAECHMSSQAAGTANQLTPMLVANSRCTEREMVAVADKVRSYWQKFVSVLSPFLFAVDEIRVIERETADLFIQSRRALDKWDNHFAAQANRRLIIQTLCDIGQTSQAVDVFGRDLVENVCPPK